MNIFLRPFTGILIALCAVVTEGAFEGRVTLGLKSGREAEQVIAYAMKDGKVRIEPQMEEAGGAAMIIDVAKQEMTVIMPDQAMYLIMPLKGAPVTASAARAEESAAKVEKTGETEIILGYVCEKYLSTERGEVTEMWLTEELGSFAGLGGGNPMAGMMGGMGGGRGAKPAGGTWETALKGKTATFPLRVVTRDSKGRETFRLEAKKVEPGNLPASEFQPPTGFQKMSLPMMGGFGG